MPLFSAYPVICSSGTHLNRQMSVSRSALPPALLECAVRFSRSVRVDSAFFELIARQFVFACVSLGRLVFMCRSAVIQGPLCTCRQLWQHPFAITGLCLFTLHVSESGVFVACCKTAASAASEYCLLSQVGHLLDTFSLCF